MKYIVKGSAQGNGKVLVVQRRRAFQNFGEPAQHGLKPGATANLPQQDGKCTSSCV